MRAPTLSVALALAASSARATPPDDAADALRLAVDHRRFIAALTEAGGRRDDPRVQAVADEVTAAAIPLVDSAGPLREQARSLVEEAAGAPLGPWLRRPDNGRDPLLVAWLRRHVDADLEASLTARSPLERTSFARALVAHRPALAASLLRGVLAAGDGSGSGPCGVAMALPVALRRPFATSPLARANRLRDVRCLALFASVPTQRAELAREVGEVLRRRSDGDEAVWGAMAALVTLPAAPPSLDAALAAVIDRYATDDLSPGFLDSLAQVGPWIALSHPRVARAVARLESARGAPAASLLPLWVGASMASPPDPGDVRHLADERDDTVVRVALALPHQPSTEDRAVEALLRARPRLPAYGGRGAVARLDAWADAITRVRSCRDDACLRAVVAEGTTEAATRALVVLGGRSLAEPATGQVVVTRMALERGRSLPRGFGGGDAGSVFATVVYVLGRDCPAPLRPLAAADDLQGSLPQDDASAWRSSFVARCSDHERAGGR